MSLMKAMLAIIQEERDTALKMIRLPNVDHSYWTGRLYLCRQLLKANKPVVEEENENEVTKC